MWLFAENSGAQVYAVDYKLAPEYQFPVQIEEDEFVVRWLHAHAHERGIDPARIALGGDSAGGNQTCVVALKLRDERGPKLALQMPIYPEAALPFNTRAGVENRSGSYVDTAGVLLFAWSCIPQGVDYSQPYITPLNTPKPRRSAQNSPRHVRFRHAPGRRTCVRAKARRGRQRPDVRALRRPAARLHSDDAPFKAVPGVDFGGRAPARRRAEKNARSRGETLKTPKKSTMRAKSYTAEVAGASHSVYVSHPKQVADVIESAAGGVSK